MMEFIISCVKYPDVSLYFFLIVSTLISQRLPYLPHSMIRFSMFTLKMIPIGVFYVNFSTKHAIRDVPIKWYDDNTPQPKELTGPSLIVVSIVETMPAFSKKTLIARDIMFLHSCSVKVQAVTRYFKLALILVCSAVHDYLVRDSYSYFFAPFQQCLLQNTYYFLLILI